MIRLDQVRLAYGAQQVLQDCTLHVTRGGRVALMGPSGCGKTTVLSIVSGLLAPDGGGAEVRGRVSCVFQEPSLFPWLTAAQNINVVLSDSAATMPDALAWLDAVGLAECRDKYPHQLSGGQKQRTAIARALAWGGDILLLDEPFRGLDAQTRQKMAALIDGQWQGKTLLLATHDAAEAAALGCRVYGWKSGKFVEE